MAKNSSAFVCQQCGYDSPKWMGQCPNCGVWNSLVEMKVEGGKKGRRSRSTDKKTEPIKLSSVKSDDYNRRFPTGILELDRVLGGGIVPGMVILVAGEPGIGKSTLLLQIANNVSGKIIYVAGEESASQIANRAKRLGVKNLNIFVLSESDVDTILSRLENEKDTHLVIVDSIQTMTTEDLTGTAASIGQVRESALRLTSFAKQTGVPVFMVGHVTKEGSIAGPRVLEHMVDTVLWFEGERQEALRIIRAVKNRFGPTDEVGVFVMEEKGLIVVDNPSKLFLSSTDHVPGSCTTVIMEGTRPILVEIQALVSPTKLPIPRRSASGIDPRRFELILAVLSRRCGLPLWEYDCFVNVAGGIRIQEPAADLAVALSVSSSFFDKPVKEKSAAVGEVGLLGEVREAVWSTRRAKEARRLGFTNLITRKQVSTVSEAVKKYLTK